jgi:outer membrane lipoprotein-sorting protein
MKFIATITSWAVLAGGGALAVAQAPALTLPTVLAAMDKAAQGFETAEADLTYTKVTLIVNDRSVEKGTIYFKKSKGKHDAKVKIDMRDPSPKIVLFADNKGQIYYPKAAQVEEYDLGKNKQAVEQFLLLGFGTPGHDLQNAYDVTLAGEEKIGDVDAVKLELRPKSQGLVHHIKKVELWLSKKTWQPVQQVFTEPSGDYLTALYTSEKINAPIPDSQFKLNLPKKVRHIKPQAG